MLIYDFKSGKMEKFAMSDLTKRQLRALQRHAARALKRIAFATTLEMFLSRNRRRRKGSHLLHGL